MPARGRAAGEDDADMAFFFIGCAYVVIRGVGAGNGLHRVVDNIRQMLPAGRMNFELMPGIRCEIGVRGFKGRAELRDKAQPFQQHGVVGADRLGHFGF